MKHSDIIYGPVSSGRTKMTWGQHIFTQDAAKGYPKCLIGLQIIYKHNIHKMQRGWGDSFHSEVNNEKNLFFIENSELLLISRNVNVESLPFHGSTVLWSSIPFSWSPMRSQNTSDKCSGGKPEPSVVLDQQFSVSIKASNLQLWPL